MVNTSFDRLTIEPCIIAYSLCVLKKMCFQGLKLIKGMGIMNNDGSLLKKVGAITEKSRSPYLVAVRDPGVNNIVK